MSKNLPHTYNILQRIANIVLGCYRDKQYNVMVGTRVTEYPVHSAVAAYLISVEWDKIRKNWKK